MAKHSEAKDKKDDGVCMVCVCVCVCVKKEHQVCGREIKMLRNTACMRACMCMCMYVCVCAFFELLGSHFATLILRLC